MAPASRCGVLRRLPTRFAFGLLSTLGGVPAAWAQAQPVAPAPREAPPTAPVAPAADSPAAATPAEQPLPPAPAPPTTAAVPPAPAAVESPQAEVRLAPPKRAEAPVKRSRFYGTLQLGGGYFHATSGSDDDTRRFSGGTISGQLAIGGRVGRGNVALAGAFLRDQVIGLRSKDQRIDGDEPNLDDATFGLWAVGFLVEAAAQREPGLHLQILLGVGALSVSRPSGDPDDPTGLMASLAAGYDFKVGNDWSLGALLRATYAPLEVNELSGTTVRIVVPALLMTVATR